MIFILLYNILQYLNIYINILWCINIYNINQNAPIIFSLLEREENSVQSLLEIGYDRVSISSFIIIPNSIWVTNNHVTTMKHFILAFYAKEAKPRQALYVKKNWIKTN